MNMNGSEVRAAQNTLAYRLTAEQIQAMRRLRDNGPATERVLFNLVPVASTRAALRDWCLIEHSLIGNALRWVVTPKGLKVLQEVDK